MSDTHDYGNEVDQIVERAVAIADQLELLAEIYGEAVREAGAAQAAAVRRNAYQLNIELKAMPEVRSRPSAGLGIDRTQLS